jgi:uncharacterized protein YndB with AHSA1/START domain
MATFAQKLTDKKIVKEVEVSGPIESVYQKWSTEAGLKSFLVQGAKVELRTGGPFEIYFDMEAAEGSRGSEGCQVLSYLPNEMLSFTWNAPPKFTEIRKNGPHTFVVLQFFPVGKDKTRIKLTHAGWYEGGQWDEVYDYFDKAWGMVFGALKASYDPAKK